MQTDRERALLERFCDNLLLGIENRGTHATGFVASTFEGNTVLDKKDVRAADFIKTRKRLLKDTQTVLLHTRLATQGPASVWANNHPVFFGTVFSVHNGTIRNDDTLFDKYKLERMAEVDSEIIPALFHHKGGLDHATEVFEELRGGFAIASIDPIGAPGTVVLGANGVWPIVLLDSKQFVVWASTAEAIRKAWAATLGTPPSKFETFGPGDMCYLKGADVERLPNGFKPDTGTTWSWKTTGTQSKKDGSAAYCDVWDDDEDAIWDDYYGAVTWGNQTTTSRPNRNGYEVLDNQAEVSKLRREGKAVCVTYMRKGEPKFAAFLEEFGNEKWFYCQHCRDTVADVQVKRGTKKWGDICTDCYALAMGTENADGDLSGFLKSAKVDEKSFRQIQSYADIQTYLHNQALYRLARETGIKRTTIDFLLHRAELSYLERDGKIQDLYCELSDRYGDAMDELWLQYIEESTVTKKDSESETRTLWVTCAAGTHKKGEKCDACKAAEKPAVLDQQKCMVCGRKSKTILGRTGAWCKKHFVTCTEGGCKGTPVGMTIDGKRWCHAHSRGKSSFYADADGEARKRLAASREKALAY